jgi:hypothetical protein
MPQRPANGLKAAPPPDTELLATAEMSESMLEVHPPHESVHTWKSFLIHVATIVVGLFIAVGLEQTVEYLHHRSQLHHLQSALSAELKANSLIASKNVDAFKRMRQKLDRDMALLRTAQVTRAPSVLQLDYSWSDPSRIQDGAWQTAQQNGSLSLVADEDLSIYSHVYGTMDHFMNALLALNDQMEMAAAIARRAADGHYLPSDIQDLIVATSVCDGKLSWASRLLQFEEEGLSRADRLLEH